MLHLLRTGGFDTDGLDDLLSRRSGLLGISETSADVRDLLASQASDPRAGEAITFFCYHVRKAIGALTAVLGGLDTLVFSGGIGENAPAVRALVAHGLEHLGVLLDEGRNEVSRPIISAEASACTVRVIPTDEESIIARETLRATGGQHEQHA